MNEATEQPKRRRKRIRRRVPLTVIQKCPLADGTWLRVVMFRDTWHKFLKY